MPKFVRATVRQLPEIVRIYNQNIESRMVTADIKPVTVSERKEWFKEHQKEQRPLWVINVEDKVTGWISLSDYYGRPAYRHTVEISIYIDQDFQGRHLGQAALTFIEGQVKQLDIQQIVAMIFSHNIPSLRLFQKMGYQEWGRLPQIAEMDHNFYDLSILGKHF